jgi:hypothetical protein
MRVLLSEMELVKGVLEKYINLLIFHLERKHIMPGIALQPLGYNPAL